MEATPPDWESSLIESLRGADADLMGLFIPTARDLFPSMVEKALAKPTKFEQAVLLASGGLTSIIAASEGVAFGQRAKFGPDHRAILEMVALNARDIAEGGPPAIQILQRRTVDNMIALVDKGFIYPMEAVDRVIFWTMVSVARGTVTSGPTGAEMAVASMMMEEFGIRYP